MSRIQMDEDRIKLVHAREEYIRSVAHVTLDELAKKHSISVSRLQKASSEDDWVTERREYQSQLQRELNKRTTDDDIDTLLGLRKKTVRVFDTLLNTVQQGLTSGDLMPSSLREAADAVEKIAKVLPLLGQNPVQDQSSTEDKPKTILERLHSLQPPQTEIVEDLEDGSFSVE